VRAKPSCRCSPFITDVNSVGLKAMQGLTFITAFYWDRDDESRAWSKRFFELRKRMPTIAHAAIYSAVRHYLRAIEAAGTDEAKAVMAKMREIPVNDFYEEREGTRRRPHGARHVLRAGQNAGGIERPVGLLQESVDHSGRSSFLSLGRRRMAAGQTAIGGYAASTGVHHP
jgi:Periplasmic binding protein